MKNDDDAVNRFRTREGAYDYGGLQIQLESETVELTILAGPHWGAKTYPVIPS